jgi:hypothetical protein
VDDEVAHRLGDRVSQRGRAGHVAGVRQHGARHGDAFGRVAVQKLRGGASEVDECQLPGEVDRVVHTGVHALPAGGAVDVGGIAGQEHPPDAVVADHALVDHEAREPLRIGQGDAARAARVDDRLHLVQRGVVTRLAALVRDDAAAPAGEREEEQRALGAPVDPQFVGGDAGALRVHVGENEALGQGIAGEREPERGADRRAGAVAADQPARRRGLGGAVGAAQGAGDALGGFGEGHQFGVALDGDAETREVRLEQAFGLGLGDDQHERVGAVEPAEGDPGEALGAAAHARTLYPEAGGDEGLGEAGAVEELERPRPDGQGLRRVGPGGGAVDDAQGDAVTGKLHGEGEPDGARTGNEHGGHGEVSWWRCDARMAVRGSCRRRG